jgi:hypothetical protein
MAAACFCCVDADCADLVLRTIRRSIPFHPVSYPASTMALATSLAALAATAIFAFIAAAFGHQLLRKMRIEFSSDLEHLLICEAIGVICFEILIFVVQLSGHIRAGVIAVCALITLLSIREFESVRTKLFRSLQSAFIGSAFERSLAALAGTILFLQGFAAMAPLTGSDALHYHFTVPLLVLKTGFHPNFFLSHSFFTGQSHLLILAGLTMGGTQLGMGFLFLGGALTAMAAACLARRWTTRSWSLIVAVLFLLTPVVFWQLSAAGAPDIWMAFFATMSVLVISRSTEFSRFSGALLAGALAGGVAGAKYTGCFIALSIAIAYFWENRSLRGASIFLFSSVAAGIWPYARNLFWAGDPFFPFLLARISPGKVNAFTLASYLADTGASAQKSIHQFLTFPFFAWIDPLHTGFWEFFGPLALVFVPLILISIRNTPLWRAALTVWIVSALGIGATSAMTRFLLPVFPIALAVAISSFAAFVSGAKRLVRFLGFATIASFMAMGSAGLLLYDRQAIAVAAGFTSKEDYQRQRAPDYQRVEFINRTLEGAKESGNVLVFLRHGYYLRVPFIYGDPAASWATDPQKLQTPDELMLFLNAQNIRWVARSPEYPETLAAAFNELERQGKLVPIARSEISDFQGMRISGDREVSSITILKVVR